MRVGIIGSGRIGGNAGTRFASAGHEVLFSFSRDRDKLLSLAEAAGPSARTGTPAEAVAFGDVVLFAVPWDAIDDALAGAGPLGGKVVIDTTNQFSRSGPVSLPDGLSAAEYNARRMPGARYVKAFNTLTSGFQVAVGDGVERDPVAMFYAGEDAGAKERAAGLIAAAGFVPVDAGGWSEVWIMEAPRRPGSVYGEAYRPDDARRIAETVKSDPEQASRLADDLKLAD